MKKFRTAEIYPEAKPRVRESIVDDHASYLDQRLSEGCRSSTRLWRELRKLGFRGQVNSVRYWLRQRRSYRTRAACPPQRPALRASPRQVVWLIFKAAPSAKGMLEEVYRKSPEIGRIAELAKTFFRILRERSPEVLPAWLEADAVRGRLDCLGTRATSKARSTRAQAHQASNVWQSRLRSPAPARPPAGLRIGHSEHHAKTKQFITKCAPEPVE